MYIVINSKSLLVNTLKSKDLLDLLLNEERTYFNEELTDEELVDTIVEANDRNESIIYSDTPEKNFLIDNIIYLCRKFSVKHHIIGQKSTEVMDAYRFNLAFKNLTDWIEVEGA